VALAAIEQGWVWRQEIVWAKPNPLPESVKSRSRRSHETILHLARTNRPYAAESAAETLDVWSHAVQGYRDPQGRKHPAVFPESIARRIIQHYCPPGGLVLDPFAGTGTTLVAAKALGFDALGVELNPEYAAIARDRLTP
jgi:DNA modification methylase